MGSAPKPRRKSEDMTGTGSLYPPPRKRFGQNFLQDARIIEQIIAALSLQPDDTVIEIGPGRGALTELLLQQLPSLHAIELDRDLVTALTRLGDRLNLIVGDAMTFDFANWSGAAPPFRILGNLPYNVGTQIILHLLSAAHRIQDMHFMLQKEVVDRLTAAPGSKAWGQLSVLVQYQCRAQNLFTVEPEHFYPQPKVQSAVIRLIPHVKPPHPATDPEQFRRVVKLAFAQRRKTLRNNLKPLTEAIDWAALGLVPSMRPEQVSLAQFVQLANWLAEACPASKFGAHELVQSTKG